MYRVIIYEFINSIFSLFSDTFLAREPSSGWTGIWFVYRFGIAIEWGAKSNKNEDIDIRHMETVSECDKQMLRFLSENW